MTPLRFQRRASEDLNDPASVTDIVIDRVIRARTRRIPMTPDYDQVHVAVLQALDDVRGVAAIRVRPRRVDVLQTAWALSPAAQAAVADLVLWLGRQHRGSAMPARRLDVLHAFCALGSDRQACVADVVRWLRQNTPGDVRAALDALAALSAPAAGCSGEREGAAVSAGLVRQWLLAQPDTFDGFRDCVRFRHWVQELAQGTRSADLLEAIACHYGFFTKAGDVDEHAFRTAVRRWAAGDRSQEVQS